MVVQWHRILPPEFGTWQHPHSPISVFPPHPPPSHHFSLPILPRVLVFGCCLTAVPASPLVRVKGGAAAVTELVAGQENTTGTTPLMQAAGKGDLATVQLLLDSGAPWNQVDRHGRDAGTLAFREGFQAVADVLVEAGVRAELVFRAMAARQREMGIESAESESNRVYLDRQVR